MVNVRHEGRYDAERNIVFTRFINKPETFEDVDIILRGNEQWYKSGEPNKVWVIADISEMGMAKVKIVQYYQKTEKPLLEKYVIDFCTVCAKPMERMAAQLFNVLIRQKHPTFKTMEEAVDWILKEQETKGRFIPL